MKQFTQDTNSILYSIRTTSAAGGLCAYTHAGGWNAWHITAEQLHHIAKVAGLHPNTLAAIKRNTTGATVTVKLYDHAAGYEAGLSIETKEGARKPNAAATEAIKALINAAIDAGFCELQQAEKERNGKRGYSWVELYTYERRQWLSWLQTQADNARETNIENQAATAGRLATEKHINKARAIAAAWERLDNPTMADRAQTVEKLQQQARASYEEHDATGEALAQAAIVLAHERAQRADTKGRNPRGLEYYLAAALQLGNGYYNSEATGEELERDLAGMAYAVGLVEPVPQDIGAYCKGIGAGLEWQAATFYGGERAPTGEKRAEVHGFVNKLKKAARDLEAGNLPTRAACCTEQAEEPKPEHLAAASALRRAKDIAGDNVWQAMSSATRAEAIGLKNHLRTTLAILEAKAKGEALAPFKTSNEGTNIKRLQEKAKEAAAQQTPRGNAEAIAYEARAALYLVATSNSDVLNKLLEAIGTAETGNRVVINLDGYSDDERAAVFQLLTLALGAWQHIPHIAGEVLAGVIRESSGHYRAKVVIWSRTVSGAYCGGLVAKLINSLNNGR